MGFKLICTDLWLHELMDIKRCIEGNSCNKFCFKSGNERD